MKSRLGRGVVGISSPFVGSVHSFSPAFGSLGRRVWSKSGELSGKKRRILVESPAFCAETLRVSIRLFRSVFALLAESIDAPPGERSFRLAKKLNRVCPA